jgi:hypothetical protein
VYRDIERRLFGFEERVLVETPEETPRKTKGPALRSRRAGKCDTVWAVIKVTGRLPA